MKQLLSFLLFCILNILTISAFADVYCGNALVGPGRTKLEVLKYCNEPTKKEAWDQIVSHCKLDDQNPGSQICFSNTVKLSTWTYNLGSNLFIRYFHFRGDTLMNISEGSYGG